MATDRQIAANLENSGKSSGPVSESGRARSALNSTRHGLAGESANVAAALSPEFRERRAKWAAEYGTLDEAAGWALDRAVAASLQIERCERALDDLVATTRLRARLAWDQDRAVEAATIAGRLARDPVLVARQLETTLAGVSLLIEAWLGLASALQAGGDWSDDQASKALDLLGVAPGLRTGVTPIDAPPGVEPGPHRLRLALEEVARLEEIRDEAMVPLDELEREQAMAGDVAMLSRPGKLLLRYERDAWRRHREAMKDLKAATEAPTAPAVAPPPPRPAEPELKATRSEPLTARPSVADRLLAMEMPGEDAWLDAMERRIEGLTASRPSVTERSQFAAIAAGRG